MFWGSLGTSPFPLFMGRVMVSAVSPRSHIWPFQGSELPFFISFSSWVWGTLCCRKDAVLLFGHSHE